MKLFWMESSVKLAQCPAQAVTNAFTSGQEDGSFPSEAHRLNLQGSSNQDSPKVKSVWSRAGIRECGLCSGHSMKSTSYRSLSFKKSIETKGCLTLSGAVYCLLSNPLQLMVQHFTYSKHVNTRWREGQTVGGWQINQHFTVLRKSMKNRSGGQASILLMNLYRTSAVCQALLLILGRQSLVIDLGDHFCFIVLSRHLYLPIGLTFLPTLISIHRQVLP